MRVFSSSISSERSSCSAVLCCSIDLLDVPLLGFGFVFRVLQFFFGDHAEIPAALRAAVVGLDDFGFGFQVADFRVDAAGFCAGGFQIGDDLAIVELRHERAGFDARGDVGEEFRDDAVALRGEIELMLDDDRAGDDERCIRNIGWARRWRGKRGGWWRGTRRGSGSGVRGRRSDRPIIAAANGQHKCAERQRDRMRIFILRHAHQPIQSHSFDTIQMYGRRSKTYPAG